MTADTSEKGLESLIVRAMTGRVDLLSPPHVATETSAPVAGGTGWLLGDPKHYDRTACVDLVQLRGFIAATQPQLLEVFSLEADGPTRRQFLARLMNEIGKRGTVEDAVAQYRRDRDPREPLFAFGRCVVHFAVDDSEVRFCTELKGKASWFLPFNQGYNDGAGNPPNPNGLKTAYLWERVLTPAGLTEILENYAQIVSERDRRTGKKKQRQIFPRYHQLDVVRKLLADTRSVGVGKRYLIQHSAGSGKSNSIAWLAHQLIGIKKDDKDAFDSIIVVTDRTILDEQIQENIKQFAQVSAVVGAVNRGGGRSKTEQLSQFLQSGKKIIISTVQTFPFLLKEIGDTHRGKRFAIIIDEAHSSQGGKTASAMSAVLADNAEDPEDVVNDELERRIKARKMLTNSSYFAFTATPKNNPSFKRFVTDMVFGLTNDGSKAPTVSVRALAAVAEELQESQDPLDQLAAALVPVLQTHSRLTLKDAFAIARDRGMSESDAFVAVERLARRSASAIRRYYIDRSGTAPRLLEPEEVGRTLKLLHEEKRDRTPWASSVEVAWATSPEAAIRQVGAA